MTVANFLLLTLLCVAPLLGIANQATTPQATRRTPPDEDSPSPLNTPAKVLKYQHEDTMKDIEKLVKLVNEIHDEMDKAGENVLPLGTLKKLDEVERLTRKI